MRPPWGKKHVRKGREEKSGEGGDCFSFRHQVMSQKTVGLREVEDRAGLPLRDSSKHSGPIEPHCDLDPGRRG